MATYEELKTKGWQNLNSDERKQFQELKKSQPIEMPPVEIEKPKDETITLTKTSLKQMMEEIRTEERAKTQKIKDNEWQEFKAPAKRKHTCTMKVYRKDSESEPGIIVDWKRIRTERDPETKKMTYHIYKLTIRYDDGHEDTVEIPVHEFNSFQETETCEIIKIEERKLQKKQGETRASKISRDDTGNEMILGDEKTSDSVPLIVVKDSPILTIKRPNGQVMEIGIDRING